MPRRVKEEDRTETIIRGLLKEPDNRRCINCNSLGPQYVCTTFWTFVCTNCSGVHREFSHRVKSVSVAKFSDDEMMALKAGGNESAKQIYFRTWDPQHNFYPDSSDLQRLREFVHLVYVDRKYAGDRSSNKLPRVKSDSRGNFSDWPSEKARWGRRDDYLGRSAGSSSGRDGFSECSIFKKSSSSGSIGLSLSDFLEERTPRNTQEMPRSISHRNRSTRLEIVDDRFREDGRVKSYERNSLKESGSMSRSPSSLRNTTSLPIIRPVELILGDEVPQLRIGVDDQKADEGSAGGQKAADATIVRSTGTNEKGNEATAATSLIDFFDGKPEAEKMASETNNESSSTAYSTTQASAAMVPINSIESLLFELSSPGPSSAACTSLMSPSAAPAQLNCTDSIDVETTKVPGTPNSSEALAITVIASDQPLDRDNAYPVMQDMQTHQPPFNTSFNSLQSASSVESLMNQQGNRSSAPDDLRRTKSVPAVQSLQTANPSPSVRNEIPEDLFTSGYPSFLPAGGGWQTNLPHGAGYNMQFHPPAMPLAGYLNSPKPKNPFDIDDDRFQVQATTFPYMAPFQGDLPNMPAAAASEFQQSPYASSLPSQAQNMPSYGMNMHLVPGAYMAQLSSNNMLLTRPEGNANFDRSEDAFASLYPIQRGSGAHSLPAAPTPSLSRAGNPFG